MAEIDREGDGFIYAIAILEPRVDFWDIEFPAVHKSEEALARMLMECSFCQRREVVYLNEMELKSFEIRRCIARLCRHCDSPAIWIEAHSDTKHKDGVALTAVPEERVAPRRNRTRVKARVLACIRRRGFEEEVAVCEDLSKGGISFRRHAAGSSCAVHSRSWCDLCADSNCVFTGDYESRVVPARRSIFEGTGIVFSPWFDNRLHNELGFSRREDRLPVDDGVPEHALVSPIEIAMQRIEIERDDVAAADRRV
jgi:hypothetical protein